MHLPALMPADEARYLERREIERAIWGPLQAGANVVVSGPRRSGKTSLLNRIGRIAQTDHLRWSRGGAAGKRSVVLLDAQVAGPERVLLRKLADVPVGEGRPESALPGESMGRDDDGVLRDLEGVCRDLGAAGVEVLLLIDEIDLPLSGGNPDLWRRILGRLFLERALRLVVTADSFNLEELGIKSVPGGMALVEMTPWTASEIRSFMEQTGFDGPLGEKTVAAISGTVAPAWPIEVMLVMRHLMEEGLRPPVPPASLLDDDQLADYGTALLDRALSRLDRPQRRIAVKLLSSIARQEAEAGGKAFDPAREAGAENLGRLLPIARILARAGVVAMTGRLMMAATPAMLRAIKNLAGH